jgi:hypothetical protein
MAKWNGQQGKNDLEVVLERFYCKNAHTVTKEVKKSGGEK